MFTTLQDILTRYHRMTGHNTLWLPGCDHAGLATQDKLDAEMLEAGLDPNGPDFEAFAARYKSKTHGTIMTQIRRTGASCDWSRERYTMDDGYSKAVEKAFAICDEKGMLYREGQDWYLDMQEPAKALLSEIDAGKLRIEPEYATKTLRHFLENIEPWCISRQIRWGHRIPIEGETAVLDTWFSSALWPFATLGWPDATPDLETFYPAALIETADDILFFWCARMLMMGLILTDKLAFSSIYLHGIIRDKHGRKMAKSLGNGIDPLEMIDRYGCDGMRFALAEAATPGQDMKLHDQKLQAGKAMGTKLWNIARFALPLMASEGRITHPDDLLAIEKLNATMSKIGGEIENFAIHTAAAEARKFLFDYFSGWYIGAARTRLLNGDESAKATLYQMLDTTLRMLHPFMPFITEEIAGAYREEMLIGSRWSS